MKKVFSFVFALGLSIPDLFLSFKVVQSMYHLPLTLTFLDLAVGEIVDLIFLYHIVNRLISKFAHK
ncbi:hypothetical protein SBV1_gp20 [Sulfolobales Beppu virus 1]|nr:hypothetical protein SBV1_gp20 [Sulfolobales Beppu virus 1]